MHIKKQECVGLAQSSRMRRKCQFISFSVVFIFYFLLSHVILSVFNAQSERQMGRIQKLKLGIMGKQMLPCEILGKFLLN